MDNIGHCLNLQSETKQKAKIMEQIHNIVKPSNSRISVLLDNKELKAWRIFFSVYGTKEACRLVADVSIPTIRRVLKQGRGESKTVEKIRSFVLAAA